MTTLNLEVDERVANFAQKHAKELGITVSQLYQLMLSAEIPFADSDRETVREMLSDFP